MHLQIILVWICRFLLSKGRHKKLRSELFFPACLSRSGRTQKQLIDYVKDSEFKKIPFER